MKRLLSILLAAAMLIAMLSASAFAQEAPKLTLLLSGGANPAQENTVLSALEKVIGAKIEVTYVTDADFSSKLNTLVADRSLPDIFPVRSGALLAELRDAGKLLNFEPLLPEYGADILAYYGDNIDLPTVNQNGVYGLVSDAGNYLKNFAVRLDWLKKVGKEMPTDLDSLYDVLYAFTYDDPDGNGVKDTYGIAGTMVDATSWMHIMSAFGIPFNFTNGACLLEDGTVTTVMKHPRFLEAMTYLRKLYFDGVMDPDFATITRMQCNERLWQGIVGCYAFQAVGTTNNWYPGRYTFDVPADPAELFGFTWFNGSGARKVYPDYTTASIVINADCKYPELAVKLINYIYFTEEGQNLTYLGVEGVHYEWTDKENGKYTMLGIYSDSTVHRADGAFCYNTSGGFTAENAETRLMNKLTQEAQANERAVAIDYPNINVSLETRQEYGTLLDEIVKECFAQLIVTTGDVEAEYQAFVERWNEEGGLEFEREATAAYAAEQGK